MNTLTRISALALVALGLAACKKDPPPAPPPKTTTTAPVPETTTAPATATASVTGATLGTAVGPDKKVTAATDSFAKGDTLYVSVDTSGTNTATLKTKWTYFEKDGKQTAITEQSQTIQPTGPNSTTEFHVSKPDGWPAGDYQVEILLNDQVVQTKKFAVK